MMKQYKTPELSIVQFNQCDVIRTSGGEQEVTYGENYIFDSLLGDF